MADALRCARTQVTLTVPARGNRRPLSITRRANAATRWPAGSRKTLRRRKLLEGVAESAWSAPDPGAIEVYDNSHIGGTMRSAR